MTRGAQVFVDKQPSPEAAVPFEPAGASALDADLGGVVGIRVVDATPDEADAVLRQLGAARGTLAREPNIVVRFVDTLETRGPVRWIGLDDAAFTDDAFLVLRGACKRRVRVAIPLERAGAACEIACERGTGPVPLLVPLVNLAALARGVLPLHASAFRYRGTGVVVTGWTKGGKTEALLAFMENGAEYVGDEWVYVAEDGTRVFGLAEPIRLWGWHLSQLPARAALLRRPDRTRLRVLGAVDAIDERLRGWRGRPRILDRSLALARAQAHVDVEPERLFGDRRRPEGVPFDRLFFVVGRDAPEIDVVAADPLDVARRMVFSLQHERRPLLDAYRKFRFAFPQAANGFLDDVATRELDLATRFFADKPTFAVYHPYPLSLVELFDAMEPYSR